jgi:hypothetical protein
MLYINQYTTPATITRLQLQNGMEVSRDDNWVTLSAPDAGVFIDAGDAGGFVSSTKGDGVAFDQAGFLYASAAGLYKVNLATKEVTAVPAADPTIVAAAGIEFGCGAMSCNDILFSAKISGVQNVSKLTLPSPGIVVPWHQQ